MQTVEVLLQRANYNYSIGKYWDALKDYDLLIAKDSLNPKYFNLRGVVKEKSGDLQGAISDYGIAVNLDKNFVLGYYNRANVYISLREFKQACSDLQIAVNLGSKRAQKLYYSYCRE